MDSKKFDVLFKMHLIARGKIFFLHTFIQFEINRKWPDENVAKSLSETTSTI